MTRGGSHDGVTLALAPALATAPALAEESAQPITVSVSLRSRATSTSTRLTASASIPLPDCPSGLRFLVRELQASHQTSAPDTYYGMRASCKTWEVFVPTQQNSECDAIISGSSLSGFRPTFQVHLGGYCGKPSSLGTVYTVP